MMGEGKQRQCLPQPQVKQLPTHMTRQTHAHQGPWRRCQKDLTLQVHRNPHLMERAVTEPLSFSI